MALVLLVLGILLFFFLYRFIRLLSAGWKMKEAWIETWDSFFDSLPKKLQREIVLSLNLSGSKNKKQGIIVDVLKGHPLFYVFPREMVREYIYLMDKVEELMSIRKKRIEKGDTTHQLEHNFAPNLHVFLIEMTFCYENPKTVLSSTELRVFHKITDFAFKNKWTVKIDYWKENQGRITLEKDRANQTREPLEIPKFEMPPVPSPPWLRPPSS